jgi:hypothetical protein
MEPLTRQRQAHRDRCTDTFPSVLSRLCFLDAGASRLVPTPAHRHEQSLLGNDCVELLPHTTGPKVNRPYGTERHPSSRRPPLAHSDAVNYTQLAIRNSLFSPVRENTNLLSTTPSRPTAFPVILVLSDNTTKFD